MSPAEAARDAHVVLLAVRDDQAEAEGALFGTDGAAEALRPGSVVVLTTAVGPDTARRWRRVGRSDAGRRGEATAVLTMLVPSGSDVRPPSAVASGPGPGDTHGSARPSPRPARAGGWLYRGYFFAPL
ncbi:NAD(P)-binding domain-containing protein [Streptomyces rishiriensis]|uniref:Uncharacterized protein n=1 Tax=Streptomyces rishiriensis TaxID=68264 RepID=A0ABU0NHX7_STRRH|nr:NAD(P)-binding domain-containing protein [Streptomyces rishiriensis]MDQ0578717.1 hypothetical protein [Streptomyces rishiriensis]